MLAHPFLIGTVLGVASAALAAVSYVYSRRFMTLSTCGAGQLTALSHTMIGGVCLLSLPLLLHVHWPPARTLILPLLIACGFFLIAQLYSFYVLRYVPASRISPLLGFKIVTIALLTPIFLGTEINNLQWIAVALSALAAVLLNKIGGDLPWKAIAGVAIMVVCYSLSDMGIVALVKALGSTGHLAPFLAVILIYLLAGIVGLISLAALGVPHRPAWCLAVPHASSWFASAIFYFASLYFLGVVFAIIVQATRGLLSIALGIFLSHHGLHYLEEKVDRLTLIKRIAATILMLSSIALYFISKRG